MLLFVKNEHESCRDTGAAFTKDNFSNWNKGLERLHEHIGEANNIHHKYFERIQDLINQCQSI